MSSTPLTDNALSRPAGLVVSLRLLAAIVIFCRYCAGYSDDRAGGGGAAGQQAS